MKKLENVQERVSVHVKETDLIVEVIYERCSPPDVACRQGTYLFGLATPLTPKGKEPEEYELLTPGDFTSIITYLVGNVIDGIRSALIRDFRSRISSLPFESVCSENAVLKEYIEWRRSDVMSLVATRVAEEFQYSNGKTTVCKEVRVYALNKNGFAYYDVSIRPEEKTNE